MEKRVGLNIEEFFEWKSKVYHHDVVRKEGIAMIRDAKTKKYYVTVYHKAGWLLPTYLQEFDKKFGAMVVYAKLKKALLAGVLEECWIDMTKMAQAKKKL